MYRIAIIILFSCFTFAAQAQQWFSQDLSGFKTEAVSDSEVIGFYQKAKAQNLSDAQIADLLTARGIPQVELIKLQERIKKLQKDETAAARPTQNQEAGQSEQTVRLRLDSLETQIYGMDLFANPSLSFEPNLRLATPYDYVLGPDDKLQLSIFGYSEAQYQLTVSAQGTVTVPNVGPIAVSGLTVAAAKSKITSKLASTIYRAISSGLTKVELTLTGVRSIKVIVIGQARKPGTFTVSSFSTLFNLLFLSGGPSKNGSLRTIELIRDGKVIKKADIYQFLNAGDMSANISLKDNDVIRIPYYQTRIKLSGEFRRSGYFEVVANENLSTVIGYAGGFSDSAYKAQVRIFQVSGKERKISVIANPQYDSYFPRTGDEVVAEKVSDLFENRITIVGAVNRPGQYDLSEGLTLRGLLRKADGLKQGAFTERATISRLREDLSREVIAFNVRGILSGTDADITLKTEDVITIPSAVDLRDAPMITVEGEVRKTGSFMFKAGMTVKDAILEAGGFTDAATGKRLEIGRRIIDAADGKDNSQIAEVIVLDAGKDLSTATESVVLRPNDVIVVRNNPGYFVQKSVVVNGEVKYTGKYILSEKSERISDLIIRSGGLTAFADPAAAFLERVNRQNTVDSVEKVRALSKLGYDSSSSGLLSQRTEKVGINLQEIMKLPHSSIDLVLEEGDIITVPLKDAVVKVRGEVLFPGQFSYIPDKSLQFYISRAGGFSQRSVKRKTFVIASNGNAKRTRSFLFFRKYPTVKAGDEIYVPKEPNREGQRLSAGELIALTTGLASLATIILSIFR